MKQYLLVLLLFLGACGGDDTAPGTDGGASGDGGATGDGGGACDPNPGTTEIRVDVGGTERVAQVHLPSGYDGTPRAVVLNFHGFSSSATEQRNFTHMDEASDRDGYIAVYPDGTGFPRGWNAGGCCGQAADNDVDDLAFLEALLDRLESELCVDPDRIYAAGMSNGGMLSYRLACEMSDRIAAVAPVTGALVTAGCSPSRPVPLLHIHGTSDTVVPYDGSEGLGFPSTQESVDAFIERNGCDATPTEAYGQGDATCHEWSGCEGGATVQLCVIDEGGHTWPSGDFPAILGKTSTDLDATAYLWDFFAAHPMP